MKTSYRFLLFLNYFSLGFMVPVLSLMLMDKGCSLGQLSLMLGFYSLSVFLLEMPSGIMADLFGRKVIFMLSCAFYILAAAAMLCLSGFFALIPAIVFWGAGKAFASGSIDALLIDEHIAAYGMKKIPSVTFELSMLETVGISLGAMLGGILPGMAQRLFPSMGMYDLNLILRCMLSAAVLMMGALLLQEKPMGDRQTKRLARHLAQSLRFVKGNAMVLPLLGGVLCTGCFLFSVETYWQPALLPLLPNPNWMWLLGFLSCGCFAFATLGNFLAKRLWLHQTDKLPLYFSILRVLLFVLLVAFSYQHTAAGFGIAFCLIYLFFGGANIIESTLINLQTPPEKRASMLSLMSFLLQAGYLTAPVIAGIVVSTYGIQMLWRVTGLVGIAVSLYLGGTLIKTAKQRRPAETASLPLCTNTADKKENAAVSR